MLDLQQLQNYQAVLLLKYTEEKLLTELFSTMQVLDQGPKQKMEWYTWIPTSQKR